MDRFRMDNTEGFTQKQLNILNEAFRCEIDKHAVIIGEMDDIIRKSFEDQVAETVLTIMDPARS